MPAILVEDSAPGHLGDSDLHLGRIGADVQTGFQKARREALKAVNCHRAIVPRHGTPMLMPNDQVPSSPPPPPPRSFQAARPWRIHPS